MTQRKPARLDLANDVALPEFKWDRYELGNHRAVIVVEDESWAVRARFEWRRRDPKPESIDVILVSAATGEQITNAVRLHLDRFSADIIFEPVSGPGEYYFYYLPYDGNPDAYYQKVDYRLREQTVATEWAERALREANNLPLARLFKLEAVADHHAFSEIEKPAKPQEIASFLQRFPDSGFFAFPESRENPICMRRFVPYYWLDRAQQNVVSVSARPGEYLVFQIGVWAARRSLSSVSARFRDFNGPQVWAAERFTCFNTVGIDYAGNGLSKTVSVEQDCVQPLWCGVQLPADAPEGEYQGIVTVHSDGEERIVSLTIRVSGEPIDNEGTDEPERLCRLKWLNSTLAQEPTVVKPFTPVQVEGRTLRILGREVVLNDLGLPAQIKSNGIDVLASPIALDFGDLQLSGSLGPICALGEGRAEWCSEVSFGSMKANIKGSLEFDGTLEYEVEILANAPQSLSGELNVNLPASVATYGMGLGVKGGLLKEDLDWKWSVENNQDSLWLGSPEAGLQISLRDDSYRRPLNTNFYHQMPLNMPKSWANDGKGGVGIRRDGETVHFSAFSGDLYLEAGEKLRFDFRLAVTPFKPVDTKRHFEHRFFHAYRPIDWVDRSGANTLNVHHATGINPYINYPFLRPAAMKHYADLCHERWMKFKIYYTVRELTTRAPELFALLSLDHEVFSAGPAGGYSWLQEHIGEDYIAAWYAPNVEDSSIVTSGISRWHNFYVEGLDWLALNVGIDGLYLDDIAFDRKVMKRIRRVLENRRPDPFIDIHSANQYNPKDGYASSANLYLEHMPFIDRVWFGEYFDYDSAPDYWLIEVSGIPFGVMGEMLEKGGNPWRGALFGMTCRMGWAEKPDPKPVWRIWDAFGIAASTMIGWWSASCPVRTSHPDVLATVYIRDDSVMVALASWASESVSVDLDIDWSALGLSAKDTVWEAPESDEFQPQASFKAGEAIPVEPGKGWMIIAKKH